ncbi:MAG: putative addiction module antidote protein [Proteobacteria bacterium]|nr:putative addiction module antidote protein [Pseudomonadota bacterium]
MAIETKRWDPVDRLKTPKAVAAYLEAAFDDGDPALIKAALDDVARAHGVSQLARESGLSREALYKAFGEGGNPTLETLSAVMRSLGLKLTVKAA